MADFKTLDDIDVAGKRVFLRADLNVPVDDKLKVTDTTRIDRTVPTITELMRKGAKVIVASHFGRPKGRKDPKFSLRPVVEPLKDALGGNVPVAFAMSCVGSQAKSVIDNMQEGSIVLLENLRFMPGEKANDIEFAKELASMADIYVNDAFSSAHRAHASTEALAHLLPCAAGRLMQSELEALDKALGNPQRPVVAIIGGAKVSTKLEVLGNLVSKVDKLVIGGGMANTFLYAQGINVGKSLCEKDLADTARKIVAKAEEVGCEIVLPTDVVCAMELDHNPVTKTVSVNDVPSDHMILDVGPESAKALCEKLADCRTLVWNGPLGAFEFKPFDEATNMVAVQAAELTKEGEMLSVGGGGDTVSALANAGVLESFSCISTAGGAFLEWLEGKTLPGVAALKSGA